MALVRDPNASAVLALVSAAKVHAPGSELAWLVGWAMRAAGEPVRVMTEIGGYDASDPRREPAEGQAGPGVLGRVVR